MGKQAEECGQVRERVSINETYALLGVFLFFYYSNSKVVVKIFPRNF